jgi:hypothetical protein
MGKVVSLKQEELARAELAARDNWGLQLVLKKRRALIKSVPIMSDELTKLDNWLVDQPGLPIKVLIDIWSRSMFCSWVQYGDASPDAKHTMLLYLRAHYVQFCHLPLKMQRRLWPFWERWRAEFEDEEMEETANG